VAPHLGWMQGDHSSAPGHFPDPHDCRTSRRTLQRGRKTVDAAGEKTDQGRGKDVERKSPQKDFPSQLANPAHYAGFALSHRHCDDCWMILLFYQTGHFTCSQKRTFSLATDTSESGSSDRNSEIWKHRFLQCPITVLTWKTTHRMETSPPGLRREAQVTRFVDSQNPERWPSCPFRVRHLGR
jgi:hypothetical protein